MPSPQIDSREAVDMISSLTTVTPDGNRQVNMSAFEQRVRFEAWLLAERDGFRQDPREYWCAAEQSVLTSLNMVMNAQQPTHRAGAASSGSTSRTTRSRSR